MAVLPPAGSLSVAHKKMKPDPRSSRQFEGELAATALLRGGRAGAELIEQRRLVGLGSLEVAQLDVAEAADLFRDGGKPDRAMVVVLRRGPEQGLIVADQRPLGLALDLIAERIESGAAQKLERRQQSEDREDPRPEGDLARLAG